jgi:hypothetical protein
VTDLTPPPEQPMDDETRARIRARLAETASAEPSTVHRWAVPIVAAAAVLAIAFGGAYFAFWPGDEGASLAPGTQESTPPVVEPSAVPSESPGEPPSEAPTLKSSESSTGIPLPGDPGFEIPETTCRSEVARPLRGADQVISWPLPDGEVGIWVAGDRAALCEDSGGTATVHRPRPFPASYPMDNETLGFSTSSYTAPVPSGWLTAFVAGGALPEGVTGIEYTWPDGHVETARIGTDDAGRKWWAMGYVPTEGPMTKPNRNLRSFDPVTVKVYLSGVVDEYTLQWGRDECAQVNHGC